MAQYISGLVSTFDTLMSMMKSTWVLFVTVPIFMGVLAVFLTRGVMKIFHIIRG